LSRPAEADGGLVPDFIAATVDGLSAGAIYSLIALGLVLIFRATGTFNFAHGEFMLLAAYLVAEWQRDWRAPEIVVALASLLVVAATAWVLFKIVLQRVVGMPPFVGVVATLGIASVADAIMLIIFGPTQYVITYSWLPNGAFTVLSARLGKTELLVLIIGLALSGATALLVRRTGLGRHLRAAGQDALLASQGGIRVNGIYGGAWAVGCALAGVAGILYGATNTVSPDITSLGLVAFPAILLGGLDSIEGSIVGGVVCGLVQNYTDIYIGSQWSDVSTYAILLLVLMLRPSGLFGTRSVVRV
jgi:branched-chain amino acid transport system permease protein